MKLRDHPWHHAALDFPLLGLEDEDEGWDGSVELAGGGGGVEGGGGGG